MKTHHLMRVDVLRTWTDFRQEVPAITRAMISAQEAPTPMDIGAVGKGKGGKGKGGKGGQGKKCSKCGKMGHTQENCWAGGEGGGNGGKAVPRSATTAGNRVIRTASPCWQKQWGKGKGKGGNANSASSQKTCWVCGRAGHLSKDCKNRVGAVTEGT